MSTIWIIILTSRFRLSMYGILRSIEDAIFPSVPYKVHKQMMELLEHLLEKYK